MPVSLISKTFTTWIIFLYHELPLYFSFPSQKLVRKYLPKSFEKYSTTRIIIDETEIFIERATSVKTQAQTWSNYKHHNIWKALVGISLNGIASSVLFVSSLWEGRASDKELTKCSGLLEKLEPGDNIMADRGFDIADILPSGVTLNIPPFKGGGDQLNPEETHETARIAAVKIHVERATARIKNDHILDGNCPLSMRPLMNQVFTVCSYLTNFLPPPVPPNEANTG